MRKYKIVAVLWEDHQQIIRSKMVDDPDNHVIPTLTVGILYKNSKKTYVIVSDIEKYEDRDDANYTIIRKPVLSVKEYGDIELEELRE